MTTSFTTDEDLAAGWLPTDWMSHEKKTGEDKLDEPGGVEVYRVQFSRRLTNDENKQFLDRVEEVWNVETQNYDANKLVAIFHEIAPDITVMRARLWGKEARTYQGWIDDWEQVNGRSIKDPDGFREEGITDRTLFTYEEFDKRANKCTLTGRRPT